MEAWVVDARRVLLASRDRDGTWGYRAGTEAYVEPTVLACLGLLATDAKPDETRPVADTVAQWIAQLQQPNGAVGISARMAVPSWPTAFAVFLWSELEAYREERRKAIQWLLGAEGTTWDPEPDTPYGHDTSIAGWPWVANTHSWIEPTALAVLALRRAGLGEHARTRAGLELIRNRAIPSGGWNYGNNRIFGAELRPQVAPTGLALLALAASQNGGDLADRACHYLDRELTTVRAAQSLAWGVLGLAAWNRVPTAAGGWLAESARGAAARTNPIAELAYLLLASGRRRALSYFGLGA